MHIRPQSRLLRGAPLLLLCLLALFLFTLQIPTRLAKENDKSETSAAASTAEQVELERQRQLALEEEQRRARIQLIESRRSVIEPVIVANDESMRHLGFTHDIAVPTPVPPWTDSDMAFLQTALGQSLQADLLTSPEIMPNFKTLTVQQRVYKSLFQYFDQIIAGDEIDYRNDPAWSLYLNIEKTLYPWLQPHWENAFHITNQTSGRGIVICIGNHQFQYAATTIRSIREVLKSNLPIEVFYIRDDDLSEMRRLYLETEFTNVKTRKIIDYVNDWYTRFGGWALKPYAVLASSFREVILMDADAYFFKKPDTLFDDAGYRKTGALFFYDRTLFPGWETGRLWLSSFLPTKSSLVEKSRWWKFKTAHEQESGVVVMDKRRVMLGLLATCKMNDRRERDHVTYKHIHGDKETFWVGFEMMQTPYSFIKSYGAVIGGLGDAGDPSTVCGNQLHLGVDRKPLWWNGGLLRDKNKWPDRYLKFTHYAEGQDWHFEDSCIKETDRIHEFTKEERELALKYVELDRQRRKDEQLIEQGLWQPRQRKEKQSAEEEEIESRQSPPS